MSLVALFIVVQNTALAAPAPNTGLSAIYSCRYLNILQQPAGMTVPKCINRHPHHAFKPFLNSRYTYLGVSQNTAPATPSALAPNTTISYTE